MNHLDWPRWVLMWVIALALFLGAKALTWSQIPCSKRTWERSLGYWLGWPGMDAQTFFSEKANNLAPPWSEWKLVGLKILGGGLLFWVIAPGVADPWGRGWLGMIGLVLLLHFGIFHGLSCVWRARGIAAAPLMNHPLATRSLGEFWGRRWNTAFRDLAYRFIFRPFSPRIGPYWTLTLIFFLSGLVHELVITVPAGAGYGGPTIFFTLQGAGLAIERRWGKSRWFTGVVLLAPLVALFPPPFVQTIVLPMMEALGAYRNE